MALDDNCTDGEKDPKVEIFHGFSDEEIQLLANRTLLVASDNSDSDEDIEISYVVISAGGNNNDQGTSNLGARPKTVTKCQVTRPPQLAANIRRTKVWLLDEYPNQVRGMQPML